MKMMKRCIEIFTHFSEIVGGNAGFVNTGWAFLTPPEVARPFRKNLALQQDLGINTREISKAELLELEPRFDLRDVGQIAYEPDSGYADPHLTTTSYIQAGCSRGLDMLQCTRVTALRIEHGRVMGVKTPNCEISTKVVVNAAGPWANGVAEMAGLSIPIVVSREEEILLAPPVGQKPPQLFTTGPTDDESW
ncbi:MAG: hypothetical protein DMG06_30130 [Acidobacteria bacterium]|nr:MAG: hypothetical protein DMG06_30130 [Acidobacteriota bacterium]